MREVESRKEHEEKLQKTYQSFSQAADVAFYHPKFYGKFRAYVFANFALIALTFWLIIFFNPDHEPHPEFLVLVIPFTAICLLICYLLWRPVRRKVREEERRMVLWGMFATGILTIGKILFFFTLILIPVALAIGGEYDQYEYRYVTKGRYAGERVLARRKWNGQMEDIYGNIYED